jgi:hypothetical protein
MSRFKLAVSFMVAALTTFAVPAFAQDHGHEHGEKKDLGTTTVAGLKMTVSQMGDIKPGNETAFDIELAKGQAKPKALRLWVGVASGEGSVKSKATLEERHLDVHAEIPQRLPAGSQLWIEVEPKEGKKAKASFALKK